MEPFTCELGRILDPKTLTPGRSFHLSESQWATHCAIIGPTGAGKSRTMWQMMRECRRQRRGFATFDPGDLATDFLADCAAEVILTGNRAILKKLHHVKLSPFQLPRYDAFQTAALDGIHPELREFAYQCWRHTRAQSILQVMQAKTTGATDFLNQPRAQRVLTNTFTALATEVAGKRLAMEDVFIFFDPSDPAHRRVVDRIAPLLPREIRQDLELLGGFKRLEDLRREVESSVNRVRSVLGPAMKAMLSGTAGEPCLNLQEIMQRGDYLIVDVQKNLFISQDENVALASLLALDLAEAAQNTPRAKRKPFTVFVDEAAEFLGPLGREIGRWLRIMRKYGLSYVLAFQDLASMRRDDFDLAPTVLGQCGTLISFRSRWPDDSETLARLLLSGNLEFIPLVQEVERHGGHEFLRIDEFSESLKQDHSKSKTAGTSITDAAGDSHTDSRSRGTNSSDGTSKQTTQVAGGLPGSTSTGVNSSHGGMTGEAAADGRSSSHAESAMQSGSDGETRGWSVSVSHKIVPLPIIIREKQQTGHLTKAVSDQIEEQRQALHGLDARQVIVLAPGMKKAVALETVEVKDPFTSPIAQAKAVEWIVKQIHEKQDYYFTPSLDALTEQRRVNAFVGSSGEEPAQVEDDPAPAQKSARSGHRRHRDRAEGTGKRSDENPLD